MLLSSEYCWLLCVVCWFHNPAEHRWSNDWPVVIYHRGHWASCICQSRRHFCEGFHTSGSFPLCSVPLPFSSFTVGTLPSSLIPFPSNPARGLVSAVSFPVESGAELHPRRKRITVHFQVVKCVWWQRIRPTVVIQYRNDNVTLVLLQRHLQRCGRTFRFSISFYELTNSTLSIIACSSLLAYQSAVD